MSPFVSTATSLRTSFTVGVSVTRYSVLVAITYAKMSVCACPVQALEAHDPVGDARVALAPGQLQPCLRSASYGLEVDVASRRLPARSES